MHCIDTQLTPVSCDLMEKCWLKGEMFYQEAMLVEYIQGVFYSNSVNLVK
jgi:hypothetical protein